jgi:hypothetical protein
LVAIAVVGGCKGVTDVAGADARIEPDGAAREARAGAACTGDALVCTDDARAMLACDAGRFVVRTTCGGARGCAVDGGRVACDDSIASMGDACDLDGQAACSADGTTELRCVHSTFTRVRVCHHSCKASDAEILCD